jgi:murein DD-endopeptidase MepM/ murein hydrolase activator NlpD
MPLKYSPALALGACLGLCLGGCRRIVYQFPAASQQPAASDVPVADGFDYPVGRGRAVTPKLDGDGWYNAQDFNENQHLGEDWNGEGGGNSDCGEPVYAAARGVVVYAGDFVGWGNVVIVRHCLPDGAQVETLYGHLQKILKPSGTVARREQIGAIGDGGGRYPCHLHFELRTPDSVAWGAPGPGYSNDTDGWRDPSDFIASHPSKK